MCLVFMIVSAVPLGYVEKKLQSVMFFQDNHELSQVIVDELMREAESGEATPYENMETLEGLIADGYVAHSEGDEMITELAHMVAMSKTEPST